MYPNSREAKEESPAAEPFGRQEKSVIAMSEKAQGHIGLMAVTAKVQTLTEYLQVTGTVQPIGSKVAHVRSISSGRLISVQVKVGDRIAANDALATFDSTDASEIASQYQVSRSELDKLNLQLSVAKQQSERNRQLAEIGAIPRKEYDLSLAEEKSIAAKRDFQK